MLIFLDADTCVEEGGLRNIVDTYLEKDGIVSVQPFHKTKRLYEQLSCVFQCNHDGRDGRFHCHGETYVKPIGLFGPCVVMRKETLLRKWWSHYSQG